MRRRCRNSIKSRDRSELRRLIRQIDDLIIDVAKAPSFRRVVSFDDRMARGVKMGCGVPVWRVITAADLTAGPTESKVDPHRAALQTFLAALGTRLYVMNETSVAAAHDQPLQMSLALAAILSSLRRNVYAPPARKIQWYSMT